MTATLFLGFVAMMAAVVVALIARYLNRRAAFAVLAGLSVWFIYAGLLGYFGECWRVRICARQERSLRSTSGPSQGTTASDP